MYSHPSFIYALLSLAPLAARANLDLELESDDISSSCRSICRPTRELSQICDDDSNLTNGRTEDALHLQCLCTNTSFDVASLTGLCASCMQQYPVDNDHDADDIQDDMEDINEIMRRCSFPSTTYSASQSTLADGITVVATRPSDSTPLTTTVGGGGGGGGGGANAAATAPASASGTTGSATSTPTASGTPSSATPTGAGSVSAAAPGAGSALAGVWGLVAACAAGVAAVGL